MKKQLNCRSFGSHRVPNKERACLDRPLKDTRAGGGKKGQGLQRKIPIRPCGNFTKSTFAEPATDRSVGRVYDVGKVQSPANQHALRHAETRSRGVFHVERTAVCLTDLDSCDVKRGQSSRSRPNLEQSNPWKILLVVLCLCAVNLF